jgi:hypothetical protein
LLYEKETIAFEDVTGSLLSYEIQRKPVNDLANGFVERFEPKRRRDKSKEKIVRCRESRTKSRSAQDEESRSDAKDI